MKEAKRGARRAKPSSRARRAALGRTVLSLGVILLSLSALPTAITNAGLSSLDTAGELPAPILTLSALSGDAAFDDAEADAASPPAVLPAGGALVVRDGSANIPAERGGRVGPLKLAAVQPKFSAGVVASVASAGVSNAGAGILRPGLALGDDEMRTALAGPMPANAPIRITAFRRLGDDMKIMSAPEAIQVAVRVPAPVSKAVPAGKVDALQTLAAFAPATAPGASSLFDAVLHPAGRDFVPPIADGDHSWAASILPASSFTEKEQACLARAIYFEARGESEKGQAAVAQVILNRVRNPTYPKTICGVVYQNQEWKNRCQFSFACDGVKDVIWNKRAYGVAKRIAGEVTRGDTWLAEVGSATHYHATYVKPRWARTMQKVDKIGLHVFYRTFGGGWR